MKNMTCIVIIVLLFFMLLSSCSEKETPTMPAATNTPNATQTVVAYQTELVTLVTVPGGTFSQSDGTDSFSHTISAFKMGKYEVTYELWYTVYQWAISNGYTFANVGREGCCGDSGGVPTLKKYEPVTTINWRDMIVWCNAYSQKEGLDPVYCSVAGLTIPIKDSTDGAYGSSSNTSLGSYDNPYVNWAANGYRLPTEGEWQYAASYQDGLSWTPHSFASGATAIYSDYAATGLVAWYEYNSGSVTHAVGGKIPNVLGIYDMSGNVWELCFDWYDVYPVIATNYQGSISGTYRVFRGGSAGSYGVGLMVSHRAYNFSFTEGNATGFRLASTY